MTLAPPNGAETMAPVVIPPPPPPVPSGDVALPRLRPLPKVDVKRSLVIGGLAVVAMLLAFLLFEGPVGDGWYHARQEQLAATLVLAAPPKVKPGDPIGTLQIPRLGVNVTMTQGDDADDLRTAPGHRIATPMPGAAGNSVIMGHRDGWGGAFGPLGQLQVGDLIATQAQTGAGVAVFTVTQIKYVGENDVRLLAPSTDHRLTLVTGSGGWNSSGRLIVTAISGPAGHLERPGRGLRATTPGSAVIVSWISLAALLAFAAAAGALLALRRRFGIVAMIAVVAPFVAAGLLALFLQIDRILPPLR
jgi:sortase A